MIEVGVVVGQIIWCTRQGILYRDKKLLVRVSLKMEFVRIHLNYYLNSPMFNEFKFTRELAQRRASRIIWGMESLIYKKRLQELGLFNIAT